MGVSVPSDSRNELIGRAKSGDPDALNELFGSYRKLLWVMAWEQLGKNLQAKIGASEAVQEVLFQAWRGMGEFKGSTDQELRAWLHKMLLNEIIDVRRRYGTSRRDIGREVSLGDHQEMPLAASGKSPSEIAASNEERALVERALALLPPRDRLVYELRHVRGMEYEEIARELQITKSAAKMRFSRVLGRLQQLLERLQGGKEK